MTEGRGQQMAALLPDGRVLVAGGTQGDTPSEGGQAPTIRRRVLVDHGSS